MSHGIAFQMYLMASATGPWFVLCLGACECVLHTIRVHVTQTHLSVLSECTRTYLACVCIMSSIPESLGIRHATIYSQHRPALVIECTLQPEFLHPFTLPRALKRCSRDFLQVPAKLAQDQRSLSDTDAQTRDAPQGSWKDIGEVRTSLQSC